MATRLLELIHKYQESLLAEWIAEQRAVLSRKLIKEPELEEQCSAFLRALGQGGSSSDLTTIDGPAWIAAIEALTPGESELRRGLVAKIADYRPLDWATHVGSARDLMERYARSA